MLEVDDLHAYYGKSHILHGVNFRVDARRDRQPSRPQRRWPVDDDQGASWATSRRRGSIRFKGEEIAGLEPHLIARKGLGYVPETRDIFPGLTVRQNLMLGEKPGQVRPRWTMQDMFQAFPVLKERVDTLRRRPLRGRAADAHHLSDAHGRSGSHHDRRADGGPVTDNGGARRSACSRRSSGAAFPSFWSSRS